MKNRYARIQEIRNKGFNMIQQNTEENIPRPDFSKIRIGKKTLTDATIDVGYFKRINPRCGDKEFVMDAINHGNLSKMREISDFFFKTSGIYSRLCRYLAFLYRYDWMITPYINGGAGFEHDLAITTPVAEKPKNKVVDTFFEALHSFDLFDPKKNFGQISLDVVKNGCYYGYIIWSGKTPQLQQLPVKYCRSRFKVGNTHAVEFNMAFFDEFYIDVTQRAKVLNLFPKEFRQGYKLYKQGKLVGDFPGDTAGWYLLDPAATVKFNLNDCDYPAFISVIPAIIDLDEAQDLDRQKMAQQLVKIIIQQLPLDKNGDLVFDVDEAQVLHNNAVKMVGNAMGVNVLTTFADVEVADMADKNKTTSSDELEKVERTVFNEAGVSQLQFNSEGNIALNNSILNDEATMKDLLLQFQAFLNRLLKPFNKNPKKYFFEAEILNTTIYNYKDMAKLYKEHAQLGYSKMLPQIALGQSQSSILAGAYFENNLLNLFTVFVPAMSSYTMTPADIMTIRTAGGDLTQLTAMQELQVEKKIQEKTVAGTVQEAGRPEKEDTQKSDKTLQNKNSTS